MSFYRIRTVRTASRATAVQVVWYEKNKTKIAKHIGSAKNDDELKMLISSAEHYIHEHEPQLSLFNESVSQSVSFEKIEATAVSHCFARDVLLSIAKQCYLDQLEPIYLDLAIMRIIEPCSKIRTLQLLEQYFKITYTRYVYERLPKLLDYHSLIETAAIKTAKSFNSSFSLLLYDVTTLYFETHKPDDALQARGFSKDDKSKQPQIVIGLLVTEQGFPLIHAVFKGNTFEGHTMLSIVKKFQTKYVTEKPIIVGDAAMLSQKNREELQKEGYRYIVGARLSNTKPTLLKSIVDNLPKKDGATVRVSNLNAAYEIVCTYSDARYRKDKREMDKQIEKAKTLLARQEPGRRAKFVKKENAKYLFDDTLKQKTELLLGIKGYCTNIPESILSNEKIVEHYHSLWQVEHAFRMSKSDLQARPIFHHSHDAIRAHILICFIGLMIGKYIEIKTGRSLRRVRDLLWQVQEVHLRDPISDLKRTVLTPIPTELNQILDLLEIKNTH